MIADDPKEIAAIMVEENGLDGALDIALVEITRANQKCDYYSLSIWREIRGIVRRQTERANRSAIRPSPTTPSP